MAITGAVQVSFTTKLTVDTSKGEVAVVRTSRQAASLIPGLSAAIADPLWMMGRQLQLGELAGEDASTPVRAELELERAALDTTNLRGMPPEVNAEAESPLSGPGQGRLAADLGLLLKRALYDAGQGAAWATLTSTGKTRYPPLKLAEYTGDDSELGLLIRGSIDGLALASVLTRSGVARVLSTLLGLTPGAAVPPSVVSAVETWLKVANAWCVGLEKVVRTNPWSNETQSYTTTVKTEEGGVLTASEYRGGRLDWSSFDMETPPAKGKALSKVKCVPTLARLPHAPSARFWELEGAPVDFGGLDIGPDEPLRVALAEYSLLAGDDRFVLAAPVECGALVRIKSLTVFDAFTYRQKTDSKAPPSDPVYPLRDSQFRCFELGPAPESGPAGPWMLVPPGLSTVEDGPEVDRLLLIHDEEANLGWAVEQLIEGPRGVAVGAAASRLPPMDPPKNGEWELQTWSGAPQGWFPLVLTVDGHIRRLQRGHVTRFDGANPELPKGGLLKPHKKYFVRPTALPVGGLVVTRRWQRARDANGKVWLWLGRETRPGSAQPGPGLVIDELRGI